jgi:hypothetical protein
MSLILFFCAYFLILYLLKNRENFGWSCSFTPNIDYYKEDWLLGGNEMAQAVARDSIKSSVNI